MQPVTIDVDTRLAQMETTAAREHARAEALREALRDAARQVYGLRDIARLRGTYDRIQRVGEALTAAMVADLDRVRAAAVAPCPHYWVRSGQQWVCSTCLDTK